MSCATHISQVTADAVAIPAVQRKCGCGAAAAFGSCPECARKEKLGAGPQLGAPSDRFEREADKVADQVISGTGVAQVQRMEDGDEHAEEEVQAKSVAGQGPAPTGASQAVAAVATGGSPLPKSARSYFEPRFGQDLSGVRVHTGAGAQRAAKGIHARAYTHRNNIAFAPGEYAPGTTAGRHLMAHEITHTLQQGRGRTIRRTCPKGSKPPADLAPFEKRVDEIKAEKKYKKLKWKDKKTANHIIDGARGSQCPMFYIEKLLALFKTTESSAADQATEARSKVADATQDEEARLATPAGAADKDAEEDISSDPSRKFEPRKGEGKIRYSIDARDPTDVVVKLRVRARKAGTGTKDDVKKTKDLEDAIEKHASTKGFTLDVDFTNAWGNSVFPVGVDPSKWTTSGNWVGDPQDIAHEAMHLLNLDDRYNYIDDHADNDDMKIGDRLHWFREQMVRGPDPTGPQSMMDDNTMQMDEMDVCALVGGDFRSCLIARFAMLNTVEIEDKARPLKRNYRPEHAALMLVMREAWHKRPVAEQFANCVPHDPSCGSPPIDAFGDSTIISRDEVGFPLNNPHKQPDAEKTLKRTKRAP